MKKFKLNKNTKKYGLLIIGTLLAFLLIIQYPDCYFPKEAIQTTEPTKASIPKVKEIVAIGPVMTPVQGFSMYPTVKQSQICTCEKEEDYIINDIVTYYHTENGAVTFIMHRIIDILPNQGFVTKGDNNNKVDPWVVNKDEIFCKVHKISLLESIFKNWFGG